MRRALALLALAAAAAAGGCGGDGGSGDEDEIRRVARDYLSGLAAGNGRRACAQMTDSARKAAVDLVTGAFANAPDVTCEQAVEDLSADIAPDRKQALLNPKVREVEIDGDAARVIVEGVTGSTQLTRDGDAWRVARSDVS